MNPRSPEKLGLSVGGRPLRAFTLLELLVVIGIIGVLASISVPALKGFGRANKVAAAGRQMLDDLGFARLSAINARSQVYMVFMPPLDQIQYNSFSDAERRELTNLVSSQFTGYALVSQRSLGDQPGQVNARYLTEWKRLPDGMIFSPIKFNNTLSFDIWKNLQDTTNRPFLYVEVPFPLPNSLPHRLPAITFDAQGQLAYGGSEVQEADQIITVAEGSVFYPRGENKRPVLQAADVVIKPNAMDESVKLRIKHITGRANVERANMP